MGEGSEGRVRSRSQSRTGWDIGQEGASEQMVDSDKGRMRDR